MTDNTTLTIDGLEVTAEPGMTVLEAALAAGIYIPHLCHHPDLKPVGVCRLCMVAIDGRGMTLSCMAPAEGGMVVRTESPQIDLILSVGETALLSVRDNGPGIADLDKLFEPFFTTKSPGEGIGLGLAISSGIVADFGGRLTARNAEGDGAVFEIQLPLMASGAEQQVNAAE